MATPTTLTGNSRSGTSGDETRDTAVTSVSLTTQRPESAPWGRESSWKCPGGDASMPAASGAKTNAPLW